MKGGMGCALVFIAAILILFGLADNGGGGIDLPKIAFGFLLGWVGIALLIASIDRIW